MMGKMIDLTSKKYGKWTVIERNGKSSNGGYMWKCICDCGNINTIKSSNLLSKDSSQCTKCRNLTIGKKNTTHGLSGSRIYGIYKSMISRCNNHNSISYPNYGGRGIVVCDEWRYSFEVFYEWSMRNGYSDNFSIDRIDSNGNYEPNNCQWITIKAQQNNRTNNSVYEFDGRIQTLQQWSTDTGIKRETISARIRYGWSIEDALTKPVKKEMAM